MHRPSFRSLLPFRLLLSVALLFSAARTASAIEVRVSAQALERTLRTQLFNGPQGRYYIRGDATSACYVYAESPHVTFAQDRIVVHVHARAKLGTAVHGTCIGVSLTTDTDVSMIPEAEEESIGFRDARIGGFPLRSLGYGRLERRFLLRDGGLRFIEILAKRATGEY